MANSKISALTSATTPLAGTETLPIVQGGATVKATVANITGAGLYPGSFTTLASTGNTTLGDASTDTVRANGYIGVGGAASTNRGFSVVKTALLGAVQSGLVSNCTGTSAATTQIFGVVSETNTAASAFTAAEVTGFLAANVGKGAGSTITNQYGVRIADQTQGTNNYGITSQVSSGTNKWNVYASGTAANYFAGNVGIGTTTPVGRLSVIGGSDNATQVVISGSTGTTARGLRIATGTTGFQANDIAILDAQHPTNAALVFQTGSTERMRLDASGNLGIGTTANASAILDAQSTTKGVRMPNMTTTQKNAIASPAAGLMVFDTTLSKLCVYSGIAWETITSI